MIQGVQRAATTSIAPSPLPPGTRPATHRLGYRGLLLLLLILPFDPSRHVFLHFGFLDATAARIVLLAAALLAAVTLVGEARQGSRRAALASRRELILGARLVAAMGCAAVSTVMSDQGTLGFRWMSDTVAALIICLALPAWLQPEWPARVEALVRWLVAGAVAAAVAGFVELAAGPDIDRHLAWWRAAPAMLGPYLRLSGLFYSPNNAAMYLELAVPFAVVGLGHELGRATRRSIAIAAWACVLDILVVALLLTYSRGALLGLAAALVAVSAVALWMHGLGSARRSARWLVLGAGQLAAVVALALAPFSSIEALRFSDESPTVWYLAAFRAHLPAAMRAGELLPVPVTVTNLSPVEWTPAHRDDYLLSYHWLYPSGLVAAFATTESPLTQPVPAGDSRTVAANVRAPAAPGHYLLLWDILWHRTTWFTLKSGRLGPSPVQVQAAPGSPGTRPAPGRRAQSNSYLPVETQFDRQQIWSSALDTFLRHPLLGAGPGGVRRDFRPATAQAPGLPPPGRPTHAHNLALEFLADWGLLGAGLLLAVALMLWAPIWTRIRQRRPASVWDPALVGAGAAFLAHGTVDYFLGVTSIFVLVWLLGGLANTPPPEAPGIRSG